MQVEQHSDMNKIYKLSSYRKEKDKSPLRESCETYKYSLWA